MVSELNGHSRILGPDGLPFSIDKSDFDGAELRFFASALGSYFQGLDGINQTAYQRARKPLQNHHWVFAAAMAIATVASQAPYTIYRETREAQGNRVQRRGIKRTAIRRYSRKGTYSRLMSKALEPDESHDLNDLFESPNPHQNNRQLWQMTFMMLATDGELFWVYTDANGEAVGPNEIPEQIWPLSHQFVSPIQETVGRGKLVGWEFRMPSWMPLGMADRIIRLSLDQVTQFKLPNTENPLRGFSRMTAIAQAIQTDLSIGTLNQKTLENSGVPKGTLSYPGTLDPKQKQELLTAWNERHNGIDNVAKLALLTGGLVYNRIALTPEEGQYIVTEQWNKDKELAVMATPDSVLGISDAQTYATQLGQDKNFWDKNLIPLMRLIESDLDRSALFIGEPDSIVGLFDLKQVEALRAGLMDKVTIAMNLCGSNLHMPPTTAYNVVGIEVEEYEGNDVALVPLSLVKVADAIADIEEQEPIPVPPPAPDPALVPADNEDIEPEPIGEAASLITSKRRKARMSKTHREFILLEVRHEKRLKPRYRSWVRTEKQQTLDRFDQATSERALRAAMKAGKLDLRIILPDIKYSGGQLSGLVRPLYPAITEATFTFSLNEIGIPTFGIDDAVFVDYWERRARVFIGSVPQTLYDNLRSTLTEGIKRGEDFPALKQRIAAVYDLSANAAKVQQIVRTETAGLMNGVRHQMFGLQGFAKKSWSNAQDENVRLAHVLFQDSGIQHVDFDYLTLFGGSGRLLHPGDTEGPPEQVIQCRCIEIPEQ